MVRRFVLGLLAMSFAVATAPAADWPQWRGPNRDGKSADTGLLTSWPKDGPKLLWKLDDIGTGYGSPAVVGDRIYLIGGDKPKKDSIDTVRCLNVKDGSEIWKQEIGTTPDTYMDNWGGSARATVTVDGDLLYAMGPTGDLVCLNSADGAKVWSKNLKKDFGGQIPTWGYAESVLIDGDALVCTPGKGTGMVALNKKTGETVWECKEFKDIAGYSSIISTTVGTVKQYVQQTMSSAVGVRAKDGKLLWKVGEMKRATAVIPTPIVSDNFAFFTAGYGAGCECYKLEPDGEGTKATKVYSDNKVMGNHHGGVIQIGDYVFGHSDQRGGINKWAMFPFKTGGEDPVWSSDKLRKGSVTYADGHFYCYQETDGTVAMIKASTKDWEEVGRFKIPATSTKRKGTSGMVWPHPVIANGRLYLRDFELLYAYDVKGGATE
jgi:outer membrane protein assembly factor BamB